MEKKNPYKFTLGFDKTKLTHVRAAEILNSVRDKADLIASAVVAHIDGGSTEKGAVLNQEALQIMMLECFLCRKKNGSLFISMYLRNIHLKK